MNQTLNFKDIIKKSFTEMSFTSTLSLSDILIVLALTFLMGMFIFYIYRKFFQGVLYTQSYNISLVMIAIVTSLIIMTVSSNFVLSLGMVGALSIVRFRTAIKDPMDVVFMFWAISIGIANGAGFFKISLAGSLLIALVLYILTKFKSKSAPYLLIVNYDSSARFDPMEFIRKEVGKFNLKAKTISGGNVEVTIEIRVMDENTDFVNKLSEIDGVGSAGLVAYNGDYVS